MRSSLKTVRLRATETRWVDTFIKQNQWVGSFSDLARIAILDFIQRKDPIQVQPVNIHRAAKERPKFLWDYDLDEEEVRTLLATQPFSKKAWLLARILEEATFDDVWKYLTPDDVREALPKLRMNEKRKRHWEYTLNEWSSK